jgi:hypothetical protein
VSTRRHRSPLPPVQVHDIDDLQAFVRTAVYRKLVRLRDDQEFEEMVAEGMVIVLDLARRYDPGKDRPSTKPGHVCKTERCCKPSFAGYASRLLPPKLLDAWHAHHPEHLLKTQEDGSRKWVYLQEACSLDDPVSTGINVTSTVRYPERQVGAADRPTTNHVGKFTPVPETSPS